MTRVEVRAATASAGGRLLLALLVLAVFGRVLGHEFLSWDDDIHVTHNAWLRPPSLAGLASFWSEPFKGLYTPLAYTWWMLLTAVSVGGDGAPGEPLAPLWYAAGQLVLHVAASWLAFALLRRLLRTRGAALVGAALFAVHPLQVEAVAWMSEARGVLSGVCALGALILVLDARGSSSDGAGRGRSRFAAATVCLLLALLAKPSAVVVPPLAALLLVARGGSLPATLRTTLPWFVLAGAFAWISARLQADAQQAAAAPLVERLVVALDSIGYYAAKLVWPTGLAPDHGRTPGWVAAEGWRQGYALAGAGVAAVAVVGLLRRRPRLWAPPAIAICALGPVLGLIPFDHQLISTVADRYAYVAMVGAALGLGHWVESGRGASPRVRQLAAAGAIAALALLAARQTGHWRSTRALFAHNAAVRPQSGLAQMQLGIADEAAFDWPAARDRYLRVLESDPTHAKAWANLGNARFALGDLEGARDAYGRSIELRPKGRVARGNKKRLDRRIEAWEESVAEEREAAQAGDPRALRRRAGALRELGRLEQAASDYEAALAGRPGWRAVQLELAWVLATARSGTASPERALELVDGIKSPRARWVRAMALARLGDREAALLESRAAAAAAEGGEDDEDAELGARIRGWIRGLERGEPAVGLRP